MDVQALKAEIALLGVPLPYMDDVGEGGFRATCMICETDWTLEPPQWWRTTDYEIGALRAYVEHVHATHAWWHDHSSVKEVSR